MSSLKKMSAYSSPLCPLSATVAVMKMVLAMRGLGERLLPLQSLSGRSSGRLAGLPLGRLLEGGR